MTDRESGGSWQPPDQPDADPGPDDESVDDGRLAADEEALRRLFRETVEGIEPPSGSLAYLQQAVTIRRRRRQGLLIGVVTMVLLSAGTPALLYVAADNDDGSGQAVEAGHSQDTGVPHGRGDAPQDAGGPLPNGDSAAPSQPSPVEDGQEPPPEERILENETPPERETLGVSSPRCSRDQLGDAATDLSEADGKGRIYGNIQLTNISQKTCRIKGSDALTASAQGGAVQNTVQIVDRTEGDKAFMLPGPEADHNELILLPGDAYAVRFAWIPSGSEAKMAGCGPGSAPEPPPTGERPGDDEDAAPAGGDEGTLNDDTQDGDSSDGPDSDTGGSSDDGTGEDSSGGSSLGASVLLRYTPAAGDPQAAQIRLPDACSGTIYRTGLLNVPAR